MGGRERPGRGDTRTNLASVRYKGSYRDLYKILYLDAPGRCGPKTSIYGGYLRAHIGTYIEAPTWTHLADAVQKQVPQHHLAPQIQEYAGNHRHLPVGEGKGEGVREVVSVCVCGGGLWWCWCWLWCWC